LLPLICLLNMPLNLFDLPLVGSYTLLEWACAGLGLLSVIGNLRLRRWAWLTQAVSGLGYSAVFFHQGLYGLSAVQVYFIGIALWAWWTWASAPEQNAMKIKSLTAKQTAATLGLWLLTSLLIGWLLIKVGELETASVDAFTTVGSVIAQWFMARYIRQTWHIWFVVNLVSVALFFHSGLIATSLLYAVFAALAVAGIRSWTAK
jgi:nicotinamide mononucleotide transporter